MYQPPHHREDRLEVQHGLVRAHPLGLLVSNGPDQILANPLPFLLDPAASPLGTIRAHMARANPQWRTLDGAEVLVVFQGPHAYITPSWYAAKSETGRVVPTWNYMMVQARGRARVFDGPDDLAGLVGRLTDLHETGRPDPWSMADAPESFIQAQLKGIVGIEIPIVNIDGKWKVSQNRPAADTPRIAGGLDSEGAGALAEVVRAYGRDGD